MDSRFPHRADTPGKNSRIWAFLRWLTGKLQWCVAAVVIFAIVSFAHTPVPQQVKDMVLKLKMEDVFAPYKIFTSNFKYNGLEPYGRSIKGDRVQFDYLAEIRTARGKIIRGTCPLNYIKLPDGTYDVSIPAETFTFSGNRMILTDSTGFEIYEKPADLFYYGSMEFVGRVPAWPGAVFADTAQIADGWIIAAGGKSGDMLCIYNRENDLVTQYPLPRGYIAADKEARKLIYPKKLFNEKNRFINPKGCVISLDDKGENILYSCERPTENGYEEFSFVYNTATEWTGIPHTLAYRQAGDEMVCILSFETGPDSSCAQRPYSYGAYRSKNGIPAGFVTFHSDVLPPGFTAAGTAHGSGITVLSTGSDFSCVRITSAASPATVTVDFTDKSINTLYEDIE